MNWNCSELISRHCRPLQPQPTDTPARLDPVADVRAVLFDIYGTMLISAAGDITLQSGTSSDDCFRDALRAVGVEERLAAIGSANSLQETIARHHLASQARGIEYPEVNIIEVWEEILHGLGLPTEPAERLAVEYEMRVNPVWPMPQLLECLSGLGRLEIPFGVISNAQEMTAQMFPALLGKSLAELGFAPDLLFFSYLIGQSKPGPGMFQAAASALLERDILPENVLFVGNDALKDGWAAAQLGFRTVLFAGDQRSLRLHADDPRLHNYTPDAVITDLGSLLECIE